MVTCARVIRAKKEKTKTCVFNKRMRVRKANRSDSSASESNLTQSRTPHNKSEQLGFGFSLVPPAPRNKLVNGGMLGIVAPLNRALTVRPGSVRGPCLAFGSPDFYVERSVALVKTLGA